LKLSIFEADYFADLVILPKTHCNVGFFAPVD